MIRPKGLGRGLDALLSGGDDVAPAKDSQQTLAIDRLAPGRYQPRTRMDEAALDDLAASIREQGVMQPILVRPVDGGRYEIIAGERRWRAAKKAGLREVPARRRRVRLGRGVPAQQMRPARLACPRCARQPDDERRRARGEFFEEALDRRDVREAMQPLGRRAQFGRRLRAAQHQQGLNSDRRWCCSCCCR